MVKFIMNIRKGNTMLHTSGVIKNFQFIFILSYYSNSKCVTYKCINAIMNTRSYQKKIIINTRSLVRQKSFAFPTCFQKRLRQPSIFRMVKILVLNLCCNKKLGYTKVTSKFVVCLKGIVVVCNQWWSQEFSLGEAKLKAKLI